MDIEEFDIKPIKLEMCSNDAEEMNIRSSTDFSCAYIKEEPAECANDQITNYTNVKMEVDSNKNESTECNESKVEDAADNISADIKSTRTPTKYSAQSLEMEFKSKLEKPMLSTQTRKVIINIHTYMELEKRLGTLKIPLQQCYERVVAATGVSERSVRRILKEKSRINAGASTSFRSPKNKKSRHSSKTDLLAADISALRTIILELFIVDRIVPTMADILKKFQKTGYNGGKDSLLKVVKSLGFRFRKTRSNKRLLTEKHKVRLGRITFLRALRSYRNEQRPIVYMDGTSWKLNETRILLVHAGGENGFIRHAQLFTDQINLNDYKRWLTDNLIPYLPARSVMVIDNAPYHNVCTDKAPNSHSTKEGMIDWLRNKRVAFHPNMLKPHLYDIIRFHKPRFKTFEIDELFVRNGHCVLRLPPFHPDLNPIQSVWLSMKQYVVRNLTNFNLGDVERLCRSFFCEFVGDEWKKRCAQARILEEKYLAIEPHIDERIDKLIVDLGVDCRSDTDESSDDEFD